MKLIARIPWVVLIGLCATIGLAPFNPPHLYEKLIMLGNGELSRPIDIFDFVLHATPWVLLVLKALATRTVKSDQSTVEQ